MKKKKWLLFCGGVLTGIVLTIIFATIYVANKSGIGVPSTNSVTWFDKAGDKVNESSFEVFQVIGNDAALVYGQSEYGDFHFGMVYLLTNNEGKYYYDGEIIQVPNGKVVRQMGIYRYPTKDNFEKTVPIVQIVNK